MTLIFKTPNPSILDYFQIKKIESILHGGIIKLFEDDDEPVFRLNMVDEVITFEQSWIPSDRTIKRIVKMWPNASFNVEFNEMDIHLVGSYSYTPYSGLFKKKVNTAYLFHGIERLRTMDQLLSFPGDTEELVPPQKEFAAS